MSIALKPIRAKIDDEDIYPAEDGEPMAETQFHIKAIVQLGEFLEDLLAGRIDVWMGMDQYWYWEKGNPSARTAPDIMVVFGVRKEPMRRSFFSWREKAIPSFICEFSSKNTWKNDLSWKFDTFERLGVKEYFLFDPEYRYLDPALQGFRLRSGKYRPIRASADGSIESKTLGVKLIAEGHLVRLIDPRTGERIPTRLEREAIKDAEIARLRGLLDQSRSKKNGSKNP